MSGTGQKNRKQGVLICGAYGMRNAGDEAVLDAILAELRRIDPDMPLTVLSRDPEETARSHGVTALHSFDLLGMLRTMRRSALYVNGGGSLIQDVTSTRSLLYYLFTLSAAHRLGCRVMMYGCGVGPVNRPENRRLAGRIINRCVDAVTLREEHSLDYLRALGVTKPEINVAAEPALGLAGAPAAELEALFRRLDIPMAERRFCICVRRWPGMKQKLPLFAAAADYAWRRYGMTPVILSVNQNQDDEIARDIRALISPETPAHLVTGSMTVPEVIGFLGCMDGVLAMRLHVLIFAASQSVPLVGVSYDPKVAAFLDYIEESNYIDLARLAQAEQLYAMIDEAAGVDRARLRQATERLLTMERRNGETAKRLLEEVEAP